MPCCTLHSKMLSKQLRLSKSSNTSLESTLKGSGLILPLNNSWKNGNYTWNNPLALNPLHPLTPAVSRMWSWHSHPTEVSMGKHKNQWGKSTSLFSSLVSVFLFQVVNGTILNYCKYKAQLCLSLGQPVESEVLLDCDRYIFLINYLQRNDMTLKYLIWSVWVIQQSLMLGVSSCVQHYSYRRRKGKPYSSSPGSLTNVQVCNTTDFHGGNKTRRRWQWRGDCW